MGIKAILFDLDGTLLPMDQDVFVKTYFKELAKKLAPLGYESEKLIGSVWAGTEAMVKNDGSKTNEERFWEAFCGIYGKEAIKDLPRFEEFYKTEFQKAQAVCGFNEDAAKTVRKLKEDGYRIVLATNPIFPAIATESRMRWAGLSPDDFEFYTTYENIGLSKPNPNYYLEIIRRLGVEAEECIMVGNDVGEDMIAKELGMEVFLVTECIINKYGKDISEYPQGDFKDLIKFICER